jgi:NhaC family Na+:H+ antiporter
VPWNTCGAYQSSVLGVATGDYFMYAFFNLISPIMTLIYAWVGIRIKKIQD